MCIQHAPEGEDLKSRFVFVMTCSPLHTAVTLSIGRDRHNFLTLKGENPHDCLRVAVISLGCPSLRGQAREEHKHSQTGRADLTGVPGGWSGPPRRSQPRGPEVIPLVFSS